MTHDFMDLLEKNRP